jgi:hypothetical protein
LGSTWSLNQRRETFVWLKESVWSYNKAQAISGTVSSAKSIHSPSPACTNFLARGRSRQRRRNFSNPQKAIAPIKIQLHSPTVYAVDQAERFWNTVGLARL